MYQLGLNESSFDFFNLVKKKEFSFGSIYSKLFVGSCGLLLL